jgi:hypothetical protein
MSALESNRVTYGYMHGSETANEMLARLGMRYDNGTIRDAVTGAALFVARSVHHMNAWVALRCPADSAETQMRVGEFVFREQI